MSVSGAISGGVQHHAVTELFEQRYAGLEATDIGWTTVLHSPFKQRDPIIQYTAYCNVPITTFFQ